MSSKRYTAAQLITAIEESQGMISHVARRLGCTRKTVYKYIDEYTTVAEAVKDARAVLGDRIETTLLSEALGTKDKDPNISALIFLAKTHPAMRERGYAERKEISGPEGGAIIIKTGMNLEDL